MGGKGGNYAASKLSDVFCLHHQNYVFTSLKYFKVIASLDRICLITTFLKRSETDLILIDDNFQLQAYGKNFQTILKNVPSAIYSDYIFKNMKKKI